VLGFLVLGWGLGRLDYLAALSLTNADYPMVILYALPAIAMIQPERAIVEMSSGAVAGLAAALFWRWLWGMVSKTKRYLA
jgi:hypothetical protein